jgi:hypothetical protein
MEAKEKAESLINMFSPHVKDWNYSYDIPLNENHAKQCALIAVDEVIGYGYKPEFPYKYWEEVKQELEKL